MELHIAPRRSCIGDPTILLNYVGQSTADFPLAGTTLSSSFSHKALVLRINRRSAIVGIQHVVISPDRLHGLESDFLNELGGAISLIKFSVTSLRDDCI